MTSKDFVLSIFPEAASCPARYSGRTYYYVFNLGYMERQTILHETEELAWNGAMKLTNATILEKLAN
jgi:hypothetical protein